MRKPKARWLIVHLLTDGSPVLCDDLPDPDDARFAQDVHITPVYPQPGERGMVNFGDHDFTRECKCRPKAEPRFDGHILIMHNESLVGIN